MQRYVSGFWVRYTVCMYCMGKKNPLYTVPLHPLQSWQLYAKIHFFWNSIKTSIELCPVQHILHQRKEKKWQRRNEPTVMSWELSLGSSRIMRAYPLPLTPEYGAGEWEVLTNPVGAQPLTHHPTCQVIHYDRLLWRNWKQHKVYAKSLGPTTQPARSSTMTGFSGSTENSIRYKPRALDPLPDPPDHQL